MEKLTKDIKDYVFQLLQDKLPATIVYHNYQHTLRVVKKTKELIKEEKVSDQEALHLTIASWFHDVGFTEKIKDHERVSARIASDFLTGKIPQEDINAVSAIILATDMCVPPNTHVERIIKDADCAHLASKNFEEISDLLQLELKLSKIADFSDIDWKRENIKFLTEKHQYHTKYAVKNWETKKQKNLLKISKSLTKLENNLEEKELKKKEKEARNDLPEKGVETMFRVTLKNHIKLSDIADTKANILLSVNAIIISVVLSSIIPKLDSNQHLITPTLILISFSVASIVLAIQSTRPKVTEGKFSQEDITSKKVNLLFFGNFHQMSLKDFTGGIHEVMKDKEYLYNSMIKDLYFLGKVLNVKYKLLRTTYTVFTIGIIVSVIAFFVAFYGIEMPAK